MGTQVNPFVGGVNQQVTICDITLVTLMYKYLLYLHQLVRKESGILYEEDRAFKAVPRHSGGTTMTDSIA